MLENLSFATTDKVPPQNIEAEQAILGGILLDPGAIARVRDILVTKAFYLNIHRDIYQAALELHSEGKPTDLLAVIRWLSDRNMLAKIGGRNQLATLVDRTVSAVNIDGLAQLVMDKYHRRQLITASNEIYELAHDQSEEVGKQLERASSKVLEINNSAIASLSEPTPMSSILIDAFERIEEKNMGTAPSGVRTGFYDLDGVIGGFKPGKLITIAGRPAMGKSSFLGNLALNISSLEHLPTVIFSLEMGKEEWGDRFLSTDMPIESSLLQNGNINKSQWELLAQSIKSFTAAGTMQNGYVYLADTLPAPSIEEDYCWLPAPTALSTKGSRPPGLSKLETFLKKNELINKGEVLNPVILSEWFGIPSTWLDPSESRTAAELLEDNAAPLEIYLTPDLVRSACSSASLSPLEEYSTSTHSSNDTLKLKAISLWQPYCSLIPLGLKHYETRSWKTNYRGKLLICSTAKSTKTQYQQYLKICNELKLPTWDETNFPQGQAIALCDLTDCIEMTPEFIAQQSQTEIKSGDWQVGRYAWKLENIQPITEPFAVKGKQGLFDVPSTNLECYLKQNFIPTHKLKKVQKKSSDCWYTPPHIIELIIQVLGEIDLDPCADDGKHIPARSACSSASLSHYTFNSDGLAAVWEGRIFMNPPYSCPGLWMKKLQTEFESGRVREAIRPSGVSEAIALVPAATDTKWLSPVLKTQPVCFWRGRIKFLDEDYQPKLSARQSHVLVYWGENWERFKEVFDEYGVVYFPLSANPVLMVNSTVSTNEQEKSEPVLMVNSTVSTNEQEKSEPVLMVNSTVSTNEQEKSEPVLMVNSTVSTNEQEKSEPVLMVNSTVSTNEQEKSEPVLMVNSTVSTNEQEKSEPVLMVNSTVSTNEQEKSEPVLMVNSTVSTKRRSRGAGAGRIQTRTITKKNGKQYQQAWYDWQISNSEKTISKSTYIPKRLLPQVQQLEAEKAPVRGILQLLGVTFD
ncbi:ASCH domain-containing protein [Plectonema cf. radiosum LEGE 06105]|uniref:DNA 5'-3' helicase n=1 Tax=Plectonema cf. radiosum LEGE 06105 TaxID=945769 RepID=A0A8J7F8W9_9CYAN|nr:DNA N-6-adenine-methyltransferase [Plectonema radiosum]MBE9216722.1 ASCH domain-containing protein [Plectonema cf. radiosum LEGE 06105]